MEGGRKCKDRFRGEMDNSSCEGEVVVGMEMGKREKSTQGNTQEEHFSKHTGLENETG